MGMESISQSHRLEGLIARCGAAIRDAGRQQGLANHELDELVQNVRIRLWRALGGAGPPHLPTAYVRRAAVSAVIDMQRRRRARREIPLDECEIELAKDAGDGPEADYERAELTAALERALDTLPAPRRAVVRRHLAGDSRHDIEHLTGWSEPKVRNLLYRGLQELRGELARRGLTT